MESPQIINIPRKYQTRGNDTTITLLLSFLSRTYSYDACMRHSGCFPGAWSSWHLQFWTCDRLIHVVSFYYFLVNERSGRKPPLYSLQPRLSNSSYLPPQNSYPKTRLKFCGIGSGSCVCNLYSSTDIQTSRSCSSH